MRIAEPEQHGGDAAHTGARAVVPQQGNPEKPGNFDLVHACSVSRWRRDNHVQQGAK